MKHEVEKDLQQIIDESGEMDFEAEVEKIIAEAARNKEIPDNSVEAYYTACDRMMQSEQKSSEALRLYRRALIATQIYNTEAWKKMGCKNFAECIKRVFRLGHSQSYEIIDLAMNFQLSFLKSISCLGFSIRDAVSMKALPPMVRTELVQTGKIMIDDEVYDIQKTGRNEVMAIIHRLNHEEQRRKKAEKELKKTCTEIAETMKELKKVKAKQKKDEDEPAGQKFTEIAAKVHMLVQELQALSGDPDVSTERLESAEAALQIAFRGLLLNIAIRKGNHPKYKDGEAILEN